MPEPSAYVREIERITRAKFSDGELKLSLSCETYEEARNLMNELRTMQKELRALKRDVNYTIKEIRSGFTSQRTMVGKGIGSAFAVGLLGSRAVGQYNTFKRNDLRVAQDESVAPYSELKILIDDIVRQLDKYKYKLELSDLYKIKPQSEKAEAASRTISSQEPTLKEKAKRYFVNLRGDIKGPMTLEQIEGLLVAHIADRTTMICVEGEFDWHPLEHFFEVPG